MSKSLVMTIALLSVALAGCTDGTNAPDSFTGSVALLTEVQVRTSDSESSSSNDARDYGGRAETHCASEWAQLKVTYAPDEASTDNFDGTFTVNVYIPSSVPGYEPGAQIPGAQRFNQEFEGDTKSDTFTETLSGSPGVWTLEVQRSANHDGTFTVSLTCA